MSDIYSPPRADLEPQTTDVAYAGFWLRFAATIIDTIWLVALTMALGWLAYGTYYFSTTELLLGWVDFLISYVLPFVITLLFWAWRSATPGKLLLGMKIVDAETLGKVSNGRLALRYLGYYVSTFGLLLGFLWVAWDKKKQGWHDKIAGTVVVRRG